MKILIAIAFDCPVCAAPLGAVAETTFEEAIEARAETEAFLIRYHYAISHIREFVAMTGMNPTHYLDQTDAQLRDLGVEVEHLGQE